MRVGKWLVMNRGNKLVSLPLLATSLGVNERTLRNWRMHEVKDFHPKMGRPAHDFKDHQNAMWKVGREMRRQCYPGYRPIAEAIGDKVPMRLVQYYVNLFYAKRQKRIENRKNRNRVQVQVLVKNALWAQDGTHLGRMGQDPVEGQVVKDRATLKTIEVKVGSPATAQTVVTIFKKKKKVRGLPFVLSTDNGPNYCNDMVEGYLEKEKIIHLRNVPHTPEHNGAAEIGIRGAKHASMLGKYVQLASVEDTTSVLTKAIQKLDANRLLATKGFKTANELDETLTVIQNKDRDRFYSICRTRMLQVASQATTAREARKYEREMIFCTMEDFGLIKRNQNGRPYAQKAEIFS